MSELVESFQQNGYFPRDSVVITVDDGYKDFYNIAYPILKKNNASATFFITTNFIDGNFWLWPDIIKYIIINSNKINLSKQTDNLDYKANNITKTDRQILLTIINDYLLTRTEDEKKEWIIKFAKQQSIRIPVKPINDFAAASWSQIKELASNNIEIGAHTKTHPSLSKVKESQLLLEIIESVEIIQKEIGHKPKSFCYPNGQPSDYSELVKDHVKAAGFHSAVTAFYDKNLTNDLFELRRFSGGDNWFEFIKSANGLHYLKALLTDSNNIITS